jgi:hypothetical protein
MNDQERIEVLEHNIEMLWNEIMYLREDITTLKRD